MLSQKIQLVNDINLGNIIEFSNRNVFGIRENNTIENSLKLENEYINKEQVSTEVYAFSTKEELVKMINEFDKRIMEAPDDDKKHLAERNKLLFVIGVNIGIRASDLRNLKWKFFFDENGNFKDKYNFSPIKQRRVKKYVSVYFNKEVEIYVENYIKKYPYADLDEYLFKSRKGDEPISVLSLWRIIKDTALSAGINKNIGSHSLRKTWGYWCWHRALDKQKALVTLQKCFNHSDTQTTLKYIGILESEIKDMYISNNILT